VYIWKLHLSKDAALFFLSGGNNMETRVAVISIIIDNPASVQAMNDILHQYSEYIIGRMGIPYRSKGINIISIAVDAPQDQISALSGKIGRLEGVTSKAAYSK
jgi:putative iron-only hydrogenase system regulator